MPHVSKNANFSEKGIKNARLATLDPGQVVACWRRFRFFFFLTPETSKKKKKKKTSTAVLQLQLHCNCKHNLCCIGLGTGRKFAARAGLGFFGNGPGRPGRAGPRARTGPGWYIKSNKKNDKNPKITWYLT